MLDLSRLRVLVAVAREGSITAAAEALHYAQPSVSHQLAKLEAEVGVPLLQRMGRGIRLTEAGRLLADRAESILAQVESAHAELDELAGLRTGRVRLAAFPSALATLVPLAAARVLAEHPGIELILREAEPPDALSALRNNDVDVALIFEHGDPPQRDRRDITMTTLLDEPLYMVTPADRPWDGPRAELATYAGTRWIAGCERCREHLVAACGRAGFAPVVEFETEDYVAVQALVAAGLGVSLLPGLTLLANRHPGVRLDRIPGMRRQVVAAVYGKPPASQPARVFLDALDATLAEPEWPS
ncbi:LysR family transcriptional regulator [Streptomyces sp. WI04-05B]|uniref:LysR family transcriptional regulator n=1 Tax=Streptomyces TaxID=1883 RepID=UPI0029B574E5|nr:MULTISPECIES: LysR substrate-binding domain-containing protein [unclassified Streptomyces]MDX2546352.1 LysR substrate-binding domain-containing protein [Streptomyces sp. WI04-05B]MDX2589195.1 LysR substrate-binding domain-containing protein [Streptomyces sp. WI04-05A]MDX3748747.1 LysR substrate-binding domain-containing protein [Streptomyces sp. AK08-02]